MSTTYKPNPNNTLYNVVFTQYSAGKQELDLQKTTPIIQAIEKMSSEQYIKMFEPAIIAKCGQDKTKQEKMRSQLVERKENLREEYKNFYTGLVKERYKDNLKELNGMLHEGRFGFSDERALRLSKGKDLGAEEKKGISSSGRERITAKELITMEGKLKNAEPPKRGKVCGAPEKVQERAGLRR